MKRIHFIWCHIFARRSFSLHKSSVQMWFSYFGGSADNFGSNCGICTRLDWINTNWPSSMLSSSGWGLNRAAPYPPCAQRAYSLVCILHLLLLHLGHLSTLALFLHLPSHALQSSPTEGIVKGCGSAVLIMGCFVTFAAGVCSRYRYLQSQLH